VTTTADPFGEMTVRFAGHDIVSLRMMQTATLTCTVFPVRGLTLNDVE